MAQCKGCKAPMRWFRMEGKSLDEPGGAMPCDPTPVISDGTKTLVVIDPNTGHGRVVAKAEAGTMGYVSHFATCPAAEKFKAKKAQRSLFE